jgi:hypothetical protein
VSNRARDWLFPTVEIEDTEVRYIAKCFVERDYESRMRRLSNFAHRYGAQSVKVRSMSLPRFAETPQALIEMEFQSDEGADELLKWFGGKFFEHPRLKQPTPYRAVCTWLSKHGDALKTLYDVGITLKYLNFKTAAFNISPDDSLKVEADFEDHSAATDFAAIYSGSVIRLRRPRPSTRLDPRQVG